MFRTNEQLEQYVADQVEKYRDVYFPIRESLLKRIFVKCLPCNELHPNPDDEFCDPRIGPKYEIINSYMEAFRNSFESVRKGGYCKEPLVVQRIYPDGYMILNGHHRWAAAVKLGYKVLPVKIEGRPLEADIRMRLQRTKNTRRATLDLDEIVFTAAAGASAEGALDLSLKGLDSELMRREIPALFSFLSDNGYDIWVYTRKCCSVEDIRRFFNARHARITGAVTGSGEKPRAAKVSRRRINDLMARQYHTTIHIDRQMVVRTTTAEKDYDEYALKGDSAWSQEVIRVVKEIERQAGHSNG